jgi:hypothetical protein
MACATVDAAERAREYARATRDGLDEMQRLLEDWRDHRARPNDTFPECCRMRNRHYRFAMMVYYDK